MGIKGTEDYLTIRFANPATGEVSPSACGFSSPRTPATPGEALLFYSESSTPSRSWQRNIARAQNNRPLKQSRYRWRQNQGSWLADAIAASSRTTLVDSLPTCEKQPECGEDINRSSSDTSVRSAPPQKTLSIAAGPRKFAGASQALKECGKTGRPRLHRRVTAIKRTPVLGDVQALDDIQQQPIQTEDKDQWNHVQASHDLAGLTTQTEQSVSTVMANNKVPRSSPAASTAQRTAKIPRKPLIHSFSQPKQPSSMMDTENSTMEHDIHNGPPEPGHGPPNTALPTLRDCAHLKIRARVRPSNIDPVAVLMTSPEPNVFEHAERNPPKPSSSPDHETSCTTQVVMIVEALLQALRTYVRIDTLLTILPALDLLLSKDITAEERVKASKDLLPGVGQIILLFTLLSVLWKIVATIKELIDIAIWPLTVIRCCMRFLFRF